MKLIHRIRYLRYCTYAGRDAEKGMWEEKAGKEGISRTFGYSSILLWVYTSTSSKI
jgi:hypothetical protein